MAGFLSTTKPAAAGRITINLQLDMTEWNNMKPEMGCWMSETIM